MSMTAVVVDAGGLSVPPLELDVPPLELEVPPLEVPPLEDAPGPSVFVTVQAASATTETRIDER